MHFWNTNIQTIATTQPYYIERMSRLQQKEEESRQCPEDSELERQSWDSGRGNMVTRIYKTEYQRQKRCTQRELQKSTEFFLSIQLSADQ